MVRKILGRGRGWWRRRESRRAARTFHLLPDDTGELLETLQEAGSQPVFLPAVFEVCPANRIEVSYKAIELRRLEQAEIFGDGDFVRTPAGLVWDKFHWPQFANALPRDHRLWAVNRDTVLFDARRRQYRIKAGLSLCGVYGTIWSHFLIQYLPKLSVLPRILAHASGDVTLITPDYADPQIEEIVAAHLAQYPQVRRLRIGGDESVWCETLFHVPHTSYLTDHAAQLTVYDLVVSDLAVAAMRRPTPQAINPASEPADEKIYLLRRGHRMLANNSEVESYFANLHFRMIDPRHLSLSDKTALFRRAAIVAGPLSSAFTNLIFSNPGTKALVLAGFSRSYDAYLGMLQPRFGIDLLFVSGGDLASGIHADFHIPIERIKRAYETLTTSERVDHLESPKEASSPS